MFIECPYEWGLEALICAQENQALAARYAEIEAGCSITGLLTALAMLETRL